MSSSDRVAMWHPDVPGTKTTPVLVSRKAYETTWRQIGWKEHRPPKATKKETDRK